MSETPRTWTLLARDRLSSAVFPVVFGGPELDPSIRERVKVIELGPTLDLVERLLRERDENAAVAEGLAESLNHEHGDYAAYACAMDELVSHDLEAENLLREHGRLGGADA